MAPRGVRGLDNPAGPGDEPMNNDVVVVRNETKIKQVGCPKQFTNKINQALENFFAR